MNPETINMIPDQNLSLHAEPRLDLAPAPRPVQLLPPAEPRLPLALAVLGNLLVAAALLGSLLVAPAMLSGWMPIG
ncbi:MAG: hypothetical protein HKN58_09080 [Xanthomonadales bacterium]|nr:hypothetical protein [Xanthomonadales bacterium]